VNYGHALEFGTFLTPWNQEPDRVIELARLTEELGYDLATFQDHPYQPALLDTWTLLSWAAGQTSRIRIAANVLNLPLREPAMLARSAASLDLLNGGRLSLALGAGAYWKAIESMGGPRRRPGEAVEALSEAIDLIRQMWLSEPGITIHTSGTHYRLDGAQPGPIPAHDIPIWIGAQKPRMLRLLGAKADGWVATLQFQTRDGFREGNLIIDDAARHAGRDPREIRRLLNVSGRLADTRSGFLDGPAEAWVSDLLPLVVDDGAGTLILMSDDPDTIRTFATDVAPALREAVNRELPNAQTARIRRADVRAKRLPGIDYEAIPASLVESAIEPGDTGYSRVKSTYIRGGEPGIVLRPGNAGEVAEALAYARQHPDLPMSVRSGGHGISGRSTNHGGIVIDLGRMNAIEVLDHATRRVRIEPGTRWQDVARFLEPYGWALSSGDYGGVGVGGLATAGGIGWLVREHGLTIDHLRAAEVVLADGSLVRASESEHADLFWALRGAGANFGIVTSFEFEVDAVGDVGWAQFVFDASETTGFLQRWGAAIEAAPRDVTSFLIMGKPQRGQPAIAQVMTMIDSDQAEVIVDRLQPIANTAPLYDMRIVVTPYANVLSNAPNNEHHGFGEPVGHSGLLEHITPEFAADAARMIQSGAAYFFQMRSVGGAVADIDPAATAYAHRSANFSVVAFGASRQRLDPLWDRLRAHFDGMYLSFETDASPKRVEDAFPPQTLERLRDLKLRYDPENLFRDNFNILPGVLALQ
jgi:alkanesulfonate monooxygenase SsuD/methylene tetrahydromethanopterin reductase-like flavin-dependent oxidoreductase (luciferase family)